MTTRHTNKDTGENKQSETKKAFPTTRDKRQGRLLTRYIEIAEGGPFSFARARREVGAWQCAACSIWPTTALSGLLELPAQLAVVPSNALAGLIWLARGLNS